MPVLPHARNRKLARIRQTIVSPPSLSAPTGLQANSGSGQIAVSLTAVAGAQGYEFERKAPGAGSFSLVETTSETSYVDTDVSGTNPYTYRARGYRVDGTTTTYGPYSSEVSAALPDVSGSALTLGATFNNIDIVIPYTASGSPAATVRYRATGDPDWLAALPLWPADDTSLGGSFRGFIGSIVNLTAGTSYEVEVTTSGVVAAGVLTGSISTRAEDIADIATIPATHYLSPAGSDSNAGTTSGAPWRTVDKVRAVFAATGGNMVVQCAPGEYVNYNEILSLGAGLTGTLTFKAAFPAVNDDRDEINVGSHTIFMNEPKVAVGTGGWTQQTEGSYTLWTHTFGQIPKWLGYAETDTETPWVTPNWKITANANLPTLAAKFAFLYEADQYNYGWFSDPANTRKVYLRLPGDADPNDYYLYCGTSKAGVSSNVSGTPVNGSVVRFSGIEFKGNNVSVVVNAPANDHVFDHCLFHGMRDGPTFQGSTSPAVIFTENNVVQYCLFRERALRAAPGVAPAINGPIIPWVFVKGKSNANGVQVARCGELAEGHALFGDGGSKRLVFRYCTVDGLFNGSSHPTNQNYGPYACYAHDVHDVVFKNIADDCINELELNSMNYRAWNNRAEYVSTFMTCADGRYGPQYIWRNTIWMWGTREMAGTVIDTNNVGVTPLLIKTSGKNFPTNRIYFVHNSAWTSQSDNGPIGAASLRRPRVLQNTNPGAPGTKPDHYWRNNILVATGLGSKVNWDNVDFWNEDYNALAATAGTEYNNITYTAIAPYRSASGDGANTNKVGPAGADVALNDTTTMTALFTDAPDGDLTLAGTAGGAIDKGVVVPNITGAYAGAAPDLGAKEKA